MTRVNPTVRLIALHIRASDLALIERLATLNSVDVNSISDPPSPDRMELRRFLRSLRSQARRAKPLAIGEAIASTLLAE